MGIDRKKHQKKKAQKAAKVKAQKAQHKKQMVILGGGSPLGLRGALQAPVYQCWEPEQLFHRNTGIGTIFVTRKTPQHKIVLGSFLVDVFCLGVKEAYLRLLSEEEYRAFLQQARSHQRLKSTTPERARKLVEDAEAYARSIGLEPHKDYNAAKKIFGDINPEACPDSFEFGSDGKPLYIAGPYDDRRFRDRVIKTLTEKLGSDGFHYVMPVEDVPPSLFE